MGLIASFFQGAAAAENAVEVVVGKGCLKRLGGSASCGTSGAAKKVRFALDEESEERARRRRSLVVLQPVVTKTRGRRKAKKALAAAAVSGRGQQQKCNDVGCDSADKDVTGKVGTDAPVTRSTMKAMCLCAHSGAESWNNPAVAEKEGMVEAATDRKQRWKTRENAVVIAANSHEGISCRITLSSSSSSAAALVYPFVEKKRGRRKARDGKDELSAVEQAAEVQDLTTAAVPVIIKSRSSRNGEYYPLSAQKSPKMLVSCRTTSSSLAAAVTLPTDSGCKWRKTRGRPKSKEGATVVSGRGSRQKCDVGDDSVDHGTFGEVGADAPLTQSRKKAVNLCAENGVEGQNNPVEAEEEGQVVGAAFDSRKQKRKRKAQGNAEGTAANALAGVSHGSTRKSNLSAVVDNRRGMKKVGDHNDELGVEEQPTQVQVEEQPVEDCVPAVQKSGRTRRTDSVAAAAMLAIVTENKARKAEDVHPDGELPADLEVPRIGAPITRSSRSRNVQVYNSVVEETHVGEKIEDKRKPDRPSTHSCRRQQLASSVKEEEQVAASCELPRLKQSMRNHPEADELISNANLETNKFCRLPVANDLKIVHPLTLKAANTSVEDVVTKAGKEMGFTKSSREDKIKITGGVSVSVDDGTKASAAKTELGVLVKTTTGMHESVSGEEFQSAKGGDVGKQPAVRGPVRRSTRRCVVAG